MRSPVTVDQLPQRALFHYQTPPHSPASPSPYQHSPAPHSPAAPPPSIASINTPISKTNVALSPRFCHDTPMKIPDGLERRTEAEIREELRGFPPPAIDAVVSLKSGTDPASLRACLLSVLEFYLPQAARRSLADVPDSARLREDLALDSLALAEAAFKLDEVLGIPVETREVGNLSTVGELHAFFCSRLQSDPS